MNALQFLILIFGIDSLMLSHLFFNEISRYFKKRKKKKNNNIVRWLQSLNSCFYLLLLILFSSYRTILNNTI